MVKKRINLFNIFNYTFFFFLAVSTLYPFWYTIVGSVIPYSEFAQKVVLLYPNTISFEGYRYLLGQKLIIDAFAVSVFSTVVGTVMSLIMTALAAYVLSIRNLPGRSMFFVFVLITMLFSGGLIPLYIILTNYRLVNSLWVYIFPGLINTFYVIIMKTSFQGLPESLMDSARIDGCNEIGILFRIVLPLSLPVLATIALFYAVVKWNNLFTAIFFIQDTSKQNLQAVLYRVIQRASMNYLTEDVVGMGDLAMVREQVKYGTIIVATAPILLLYPFLQKYFIKGVLIGAIKG